MKDKIKSFTSIFYTPVLIYFIFFVAISLIAIATATPLAHMQYPGQAFVRRQIIFFSVGAVATIAVLFFEIKYIRYIRWFLYGICLLLLGVIFIGGQNAVCPSPPGTTIPCINNATRWINLPGFQVQPSEFMRIVLILIVADIIQKHNEKILHESRTFKSDFWLIMKSIVVLLPAIAFIWIQPDSGISILILLTAAFMLVTAGIKWTYILLVAGLAGVVAITFVNLVVYNPDFLTNIVIFDRNIFSPHQFNRIHGWQDPFGSGDVGRHLSQGLTAMGTGGLFGHGFQSAAVFFPEAHTDFIFAAIGMDFGLIGSVIVVVVSLLFNFSVLNIAVLNRDHYNSHVCVGIFASLMTQQFWNMGMILGLIPITGVTLPFVSHGGSSILASMIMLGLILSSHIEGLTHKRNTTIFREDILYLEEKDLAE